MSMEIIDEVYSSGHEENMPQPTEIDEEHAIVEEAVNETVVG